jgi:hypothetical protein
MPTARMQRPEVGGRRWEINNFELRIGMGIGHRARRKEPDHRGQMTASQMVMNDFNDESTI